MAWIESHQALGHHPKTLRLAALLKVRVPEAVGLLQFLWWWALDYAPDGLVARADSGAVAGACLWHGKPETFWDAMLAAGFVEDAGLDVLNIHDWMDYAGRLVERRKSDAERKRVRRTSAGRPAQPAPDVRRNGARTSGVPYPTQPDTTGPDPTPPVGPPNGGQGRPADTACCSMAGISNGERHSATCPTLTTISTEVPEGGHHD